MIHLLRRLLNRITRPRGDRAYWQQRYDSGGNSGAGSYGLLAEFKARAINSFIKENRITTVTEFGCGDGHQLGLLQCESYLGLDIAPAAVERCRALYKGDTQKRFELYDSKTFDPRQAEANLVLCLDVLYHITSDQEFETTLAHIFGSARKYVILYTNLAPGDLTPNVHIVCRDTLSCLAKHTDFEIIRVLEQEHKQLSGASFIFLRRKPV